PWARGACARPRPRQPPRPSGVVVGGRRRRRLPPRSRPRHRRAVQLAWSRPYRFSHAGGSRQARSRGVRRRRDLERRGISTVPALLRLLRHVGGRAALGGRPPPAPRPRPDPPPPPPQAPPP